jgi:hypothetical protein
MIESEIMMEILGVKLKSEQLDPRDLASYCPGFICPHCNNSYNLVMGAVTLIKIMELGREHEKTCEKHPMRELEKKIEELENRIEKLINSNM